ncbi:MAG: VWA domain-containing protein [Duncaniella sp.]|nr:VWA domain-containing protein [Duncaniella sp.]MDE6467200.1 VWA domain-containing protein [Duncaniella sp.]
MITFAYPHLLYLLLLIPAALGLFIWARISRMRKLRRFGNPETLAPLMPEVSRYMPWVKITLALFVIATLVLMLARPRATGGIDEDSAETETRRGIEVMICLDVSNSMLASSTDDEAGVSRLQRAKFILEKMIDKMQNDKVGLIVFAGDAYTQLPITSDYISAKMFLNNISTGMVPTQGTAIGAAIDMAMNSFTPDDKMGKAIIVITDGENFEDNAVDEAKRAANAGIQVDVVGLGSGRGVRIPVGRNSYMINPMTGEEVLTKLDESTAMEIAKAGKGIYVNGATSSAVSDIDTKMDELEQGEFSRKTFSPQSEQFPIFAWIALLLLVIDTITVTRKISWLKKYRFFSKEEEGGKK